MDKYTETFQILKTANNKLIAKIDELIEYINSNKTSFNMDEKEVNKYYNLKNNEKAQKFASEHLEKNNTFKTKLALDVENLKEDNIAVFLTTFVDYFAKVEDTYYDILNVVNNNNMTASSLYKTEVKLNYYKTNLQNVNSAEKAYTNKIKEIFNEETK